MSTTTHRRRIASRLCSRWRSVRLPERNGRSPAPRVGRPVLRRGPQRTKATGIMDFLKPRYIPMSRRRRIYEGKAKVLYEGPEPGTLIQHFKDDATAYNAKQNQ